MKRFVSVWLPDWPIDRLCRHEPAAVPRDAPFALVEAGRHGLTITAVNACASGEGVRPGRTLADARAALPSLRSRPAEPARDAEALAALAAWCGRYGVLRNSEGADGIWIDVTGVPHLFGGEAGLMSDLSGRLARFGLTARAATADTPGAAYALARYGVPPGHQGMIAPTGETRATLARLPVEALHLDRETALTLKRLGLRRIGDLYGVPRVGLARRFEPSTRSTTTRPRQRGSREPEAATAAVLARLDAVLGMVPDPRPPLGEPPVLLVRRLWAEPLVSAEALEAEIAILCADLCHRLAGLSQGARRIRLGLYRSDGSRVEVLAGTSAPCRDGPHMMRLLGARLASIDAGFGIDTATLEAISAEAMDGSQETLAGAPAADREEALARLVDRLAGRLGRTRVTRLEPRASHIPERACAHVPALDGKPERPSLSPRRPVATADPPFLLDPPEPISVFDEIDEQPLVGDLPLAVGLPSVGRPPSVFGWRRGVHRVLRAEGPRRVAPEWWRLIGRPPPRGSTRCLADILPTAVRDYYRIEVQGGGRYWLFRALADPDREDADRPEAPLWFLHGIYA